MHAKVRFVICFVGIVVCGKVFSANFTSEWNSRCYGEDPATDAFNPWKKDSFSRSRLLHDFAPRSQSLEHLLENFAESPSVSPILFAPLLNENTIAQHKSSVSSIFPRPVLHLGNIVMQMVGDPREGAAAKFLEFFELNLEEAEFQFGLLNFSAKGTDEFVVGDPAFEDFLSFQDPSFQKIQQCSECHFQPGRLISRELRPIYNSGPTYHSPYGQLDDTLPSASDQARRWKHFIGNAEPKSPLAVRYEKLKIRSQVDREGNISFPDRPADRLKKHLFRMNLARVSKKVEGMSRYRELAPALIASFFDCGDIREFFPAPFRQAHEAALLRKLNSETVYVPAGMLRSFPNYKPLFVREGVNYWSMSVSDFLARKNLPFLDALAFYVKQSVGKNIFTSINASKKDSKGDVEKFLKKKGFVFHDDDFLKLEALDDEKLYQTLAKLIYVVSNDVDEVPWLWGLAGFGAPNALDFRDDKYRIDDLLRCELGPTLFRRSASYRDFFREELMSKRDLVKDEATFCRLLKTDSTIYLSHWNNLSAQHISFPRIDIGNFIIEDPGKNGEIIISERDSRLIWTPVNPNFGASTRGELAVAACEDLNWAGMKGWAIPDKRQLSDVIAKDLYQLSKTVFGPRLRHFLYYQKEDHEFGVISPYHNTELAHQISQHSYMCVRQKY